MDIWPIPLGTAEQAVTFSVVISVIWKIILVILGINALIIVHEFGHFLVARWCGVRCDKFYIWFDIYGWKLFKFKWGDTEFGIGVLPLGGYVKMLGQEDNPGQIAKEIERARLAKEAAEKPVETVESSQTPDDSLASEPLSSTAKTEENAPPPSPEELVKLEEAMYAKDSYLAKSVPQRMAIIVAGVVMNIIFAFICATAAYFCGVLERPTIVGTVTPGSSAWSAELQTGDRIVSIAGKKILVFSDITQSALAADKKEGVLIEIERPKPDGSVEKIEKRVIPRKREGDLAPTIGIISQSTIDLAERTSPDKWLEDQGLAEQVSQAGKLLTINDNPVSSYKDFLILSNNWADRSLEFAFVQLPKKTEDGKAAKAPENKAESELPPIKIEIPARPMLESGIKFKIGPITAVLPGSPAEKAGIVPGDTILEVDNVSNFDPLKLPQHLRKLSVAGTKHVSLSVRKAKNGNVEYHEIALIPDAQPSSLQGGVFQGEMGCDTLGVSYKITNEVADDLGDIPAGAKLNAITVINPPKDYISASTKYTFPVKDDYTFTEVGKHVDITPLFGYFLQILPNGTKIRYHYEHAGETKTVDRELKYSDDWFDPDRGLVFEPEKIVLKAKSLSDGITLGFNKTVNSALLVYYTLKNIGTRVSARALGGPVLIVGFAYRETSTAGTFLIFLCLIGANLAVLNILPIPVLDGGHLVFLIYEGITGRPPNETFQVIVSYIGLLMLLSLMLWVVALDIGLIKRF